LDKDGQGELSAIITGFNYAVSQGTDIINMSLDYQNGNPTAYPAAYNEVVAVGSVNKSNQHASYSNTGNHLELVTYGEDSIDGSYPNPLQWIYSSYYKIDWNASVVYIGEYLYAGTSQATPQVSGLIALMIAANPNLTAIEIKTILRQTATDLGDPGKDDIFGYGLINPAAALNTTNLSLTPTTQPSCGADLDCSGSVNIQDYQAWLNSSSGDLNGNGIIEITDLVNVLYLWIKI